MAPPSNSKPATPLRRASSAGPLSTHRSIRRTPADQARTPGTQRFGSARRTIVVTPHGRAAQRELNARRAGLTPGKDRRRSGRQERETPRDILRQLSRILAPKSQAIIPTPEGRNTASLKGKGRVLDDDLDEGPEIQRPRFSLPIGDEDDEDDSLLQPPQSAGLEDEDYTRYSMELPRRAVSELPPGRLSRGSFGSVRVSDAFADLNDIGSEGNIYDSSYFAEGQIERDDIAIDDNMELEGENTATLRAFDLGRGRLSMGRESDIRPAAIMADDTTTEFVFTIPQRDPSEDQLNDESSLHAAEQADDIRNDSNRIEGLEDALLEEPLDLRFDEIDRNEAEDPETEVEAFDDKDRASQDLSLLDTSMLNTTTQEINVTTSKKSNIIRKKVKVSKHGIQYPSLPAGVVKKLALTYARTAGNSKAKINKETLDAIMQATDWFFEQVSDDLGAYATHAGRKTIDESDIVTLMARQRQSNATTTPFSLAQRYLPRELLQELRMVAPSKLKKGRPLQMVEEEEDDDES